MAIFFRSCVCYTIVVGAMSCMAAIWPVLWAIDHLFFEGKPRTRREAVLYYSDFGRIVGENLCKLSFSLYNFDKVPNRPVVFGCNHQSMIDPILFGGGIFKQRRISGVMRKGVPQEFPPAMFASMAECGFAIDAYNDKYGSMKKAVKYMQERLEMGEDVLIFPEGERVPYSCRKEVEVGAMYYMYKRGFPIVLVRQNCALACPIGYLTISPTELKFGFSDVIELKPGEKPFSKTEFKDMVHMFFYDLPIGESFPAEIIKPDCQTEDHDGFSNPVAA